MTLHERYQQLARSPRASLVIFFVAFFVGLPLYLFFSISGRMGSIHRVFGWVLGSGVLFIVVCVLLLLYFSDIRPVRLHLKASLSDEKFQNYLRHQLSVLRELGFFAEAESLEGLSKTLSQQIQEEVGDEVGEYLADPYRIAQMDARRTLLQPMESDCWLKEDGYRELLGDLSAIGRGRFDPKDLKVDIAADGAKVMIEYELADCHYAVPAERRGDWMDPDLLQRINDTIKESGYQFETPFPIEEAYLLVMVNTEEKKRLINDLGWRFLAG